MTQQENITLGHRNYVQSFTRRHFPYSDFNFTSMWSWDVGGQILLSEINGNLVVRFADYVTGEPFYSFLGNGHPDETALALLEKSRSENIAPVLRLMPECSVIGLDRKKFAVTEDEDNFDYVYDVLEHTECRGKKFGTHRQHLSQFHRKYVESDPSRIVVSVQSPLAAEDAIHAVNKRWEMNKLSANLETDTEKESAALARLLQAADESLLVMMVSYKGYPIAYAIVEIVSDEYALAHFGKADTSFIGINSYLIKAKCEMLAAKSRRLLNYEQDLGISGLRQAKRSLRPCHFLKKYRVEML